MPSDEVSFLNSSTGGAATSTSVPVPAVVTVPAIAGSGKIGSPQTGVAAMWSILPDQLENRWTLNGGVISGATSTSYTPVAANDQLRLRYQQRARKTNGAWSAWTQSGPVTVTYPSPAPAEELPAQSFVAGTAATTFDASTGFFGQALVYSLINPPAGVSVTPTTGIVTIDTGVTGLLSGVVIQVRASNSGGFFDQTFELSIVAAPAPPVNVIAPAITGSFVVGQTVAVSDGTWAPAADACTYQWTRCDADITGATAARYTATVADEGRSLGCRVFAANAGGSSAPVQATGAQDVVHVAPSSSGALPPRSVAEKSGQHTFSVADGFVGDGLSYALVEPPEGIRIDPATGVVSVDTAVTGLLAGVSISVWATNSGGQATSSLALSVMPAWSVSGGPGTLAIRSAPAVAPPVATGGIAQVTIMS